MTVHRWEHRWEFRVAWRREGRQRVTRIYQTMAAARAKAGGILAMEKLDREGTQFAYMPALTEPPVIERRYVGPWERAPQQVAEPSAADLVGTDQWLDSYRYRSSRAAWDDGAF